MTKRATNVVNLPVKARLICSACGASGEGSCGCGAPYVPAGERAAAAVAANPAKSDRAIAKEIGVHHNTVAKARKATGDHSPVEKRTGQDGKARKLPQPKAPATPTKPFVLVGGMPATPARAKEVARANAKIADLSVRNQVNAFITELTEFEDDFAMRLLAWHQADPGLDDDGQHTLVLFLSQCSIRFQQLAQKIDGR